ncbi:MAG: hypothetical protein ACRC6E_14405 [Fusobacteriaceae bacterium]
MNNIEDVKMGDVKKFSHDTDRLALKVHNKDGSSFEVKFNKYEDMTYAYRYLLCKFQEMEVEEKIQPVKVAPIVINKAKAKTKTKKPAKKVKVIIKNLSTNETYSLPEFIKLTGISASTLYTTHKMDKEFSLKGVEYIKLLKK